MTPRRPWLLAGVLVLATATSFAAAAKPAPAAPMLTFRWMRSGAPVAHMRVVLFRENHMTRGVTSASGTMRGLAGGFGAGVVSSPNDTWGIDIHPDRATPRVIRVPEPIRITGRIESATHGARLRLRVGTGPRRPVMIRHRGERNDPFPSATDNVVLGGIALPPTAFTWTEVAVDPDGRFTTPVVTSETNPQLVAFDDAGGMTTIEVPVPKDVQRDAAIDAGTIRIGPPVALDIALDLPKTDLPVSLVASVHAVKFDPAQKDAIARHLAVLDQFDDAIFEYATGRTPYPLEFDGRTRIGGLPPFSEMEVDIYGPTPSMGVRRVVKLSPDGPTTVRITGADLNLTSTTNLAPIHGRVVLAGTSKPVANAVVVYSDYPVKLETKSDASGNFTVPAPALPRNPRWFIDARSSGVPAEYKPTAMIAADRLDPATPVTLELPRKAKKTSANAKVGGIFDACIWGVTGDYQYPACQGAISSGSSAEQGYVVDCVTNSNLTAVQFDVGVKGVWRITYMYTPFLMFETQWVTVPETTWIAEMAPIATPVSRIALKFCGSDACWDGIADTPYQISSFLTDPDSFEGTSDKLGWSIINCINTNPLYVFVNFESSGKHYTYGDSVYIDLSGTGLVKMKQVALTERPWSAWRAGS